MTDTAGSKQVIRKIALVAAYACVFAFGAATMLIVEGRPLDARGHMIITITGAGAFLSAALVMAYSKRFMRFSYLPRFIAVFFGVMLATFLIQGLLSGVFFNLTVFSGHESLASFDGMVELTFTSAYGFAYYMIYGSALIWPIAVAAALLFALGFLTLRP